MPAEHFDIVIVGAGLSGVGAACHLQRECPNKRFVILESREAMGGTWDLFRYPGIRSDSDMHTLGYDFRPWRDAKAIADGPAILNYIRDTAAEFGVDRHIRYRHRVKSASWSSEDAAWTLDVEGGDHPDGVEIHCNMLLMCPGYYRYEAGYLPDFKGRERFTGDIVHQQHWPEDLDYRGKRVVIIGSGATAVTLLPELAKQAGHVVMLQRSPTYMISWPDKDVVANGLRKVLPEKIAYALVRWKNVTIQQWIYRQTRTRPDRVRRALLRWVRKDLPEGYDVDTHFAPSYDPWDQRLCLVPNSDLFRTISAGKGSVVTDEIDAFTENGIRLASGETLEADIIVTATGLDLRVMGGVEFRVDGEAVDFARTFTYKGIMSSGVPNMVSTFGYINASWTLRADLTARYFCRVLKHMDQYGFRQCTPTLRPEDEGMPSHPWIIGFSSGYIQRVLPRLPKQGDREPWLNPQNYAKDKKLFREAEIDDGVLVFRSPSVTREAKAQCASRNLAGA
jgi:cation diffusion facilitator CzcD-associated flavoprotein CzcO